MRKRQRTNPPLEATAARDIAGAEMGQLGSSLFDASTQSELFVHGITLARASLAARALSQKVCNKAEKMVEVGAYATFQSFKRKRVGRDWELQVSTFYRSNNTIYIFIIYYFFFILFIF